jgi:hypothetical protein
MPETFDERWHEDETEDYTLLNRTIHSHTSIPHEPPTILERIITAVCVVVCLYGLVWCAWGVVTGTNLRF